jgi:hypothetical protein
MGRSVNYLDNAEVIIYFNLEIEENGQLSWDDTIENLKSSIQKRLPSYSQVDKWDNRETKIILQNYLCNIGVSEYCGLVSLSVAPRNNDFVNEHESLAKHHAGQIEKTLQKIVDDITGSRLIRKGTFSNGTGVFELAKDNKAIFDNAERIL